MDGHFTLGRAASCGVRPSRRSRRDHRWDLGTERAVAPSPCDRDTRDAREPTQPFGRCARNPASPDRTDSVERYMMIDELRFATRRLARRPGLVLAVVGTIALGVGATTAIYSALRAVILRPFPYPEADRLLAITENGPQRGLDNFGVPLPTYAEWRAQSKSFRDLALEVRPGGPLRIVLSGNGDEPQIVAAALVSMNW